VHGKKDALDAIKKDGKVSEEMKHPSPLLEPLRPLATMPGVNSPGETVPSTTAKPTTQP